MTYSKELKILFIDFAIWIPLMLFFVIILLYLIYEYPMEFDIKIHNFYITYILNIIYIIIFIIFFWCLRILGLGKKVDLLEIKLKIQELLYTKYNLPLILKISHYLMLIIIIFCWLLIIIKIKQYLEFQIYKIYFYYKNKKYLTGKLYTNLDKFSDTYFCYYGFKHNISKIIWFFYKKFPNYFTYNEKIFDILPLYVKWFITCLFYSLVLHECFTNNFILHKTFYYLIIYIILRLWIRLDNVEYAKGSFACILMERAYKEPEILYVNLTIEEENMLLYFIKNPTKGMELVEYKTWIILDICTIEYYRKFILLDKNISPEPDKKLYHNKYLELGFYAEEVIKKNGKNFVKE